MFCACAVFHSNQFLCPFSMALQECLEKKPNCKGFARLSICENCWPQADIAKKEACRHKYLGDQTCQTLDCWNPTKKGWTYCSFCPRKTPEPMTSGNSAGRSHRSRSRQRPPSPATPPELHQQPEEPVPQLPPRAPPAKSDANVIRWGMTKWRHSLDNLTVCQLSELAFHITSRLRDQLLENDRLVPDKLKWG